MKRLLLLVFLSPIFSIVAQPVVEGTYLPVRNTAILQVWDTTFATSLLPPTLGPTQSWDYSTLFVANGDTFTTTTLDGANTPHSNHFPNATHATYWNVPYPLQDSLYSYFIVDTLGFHKIGGFSEKVQYDTSFVNTPSEHIMPHEVSYQMTPINNSSVTIGYGFQGGFNVEIAQHKSKTFTGVGYGTLMTPLGTFNDVVLMKEQTQRFDTVFVDFNNNGNYHDGGDINIPSTNHAAYYHFVRNNTFASTHLMLLKCDQTSTWVQYGWYTLPVAFGSIEGTVYDSTGAFCTDGEVYLYREYSNFTKNDILARTFLDANGNYRFDTIPLGEYRIACRPNLTNYPGALTTYYGDTTDWVNCPTVVTTSDTTGIDINIQYFNNLLGTGEVTGTIIQELSYGKKGWSNPILFGEPVKGVNVSLEQIPGGIMMGGQTETQSDGTFVLPNVDPGNYTVWVDVPGLHMTGSYNITITSSGEQISQRHFVVSLDSIYPITYPSSIKEDKLGNSKLVAYPNPFNSEITVEFNLAENSENSEIVVTNVLGESVLMLQSQSNNLGKNKQIIQANKLVNGIYFITLIQNGERIATKKVIKNQ